MSLYIQIWIVLSGVCAQTAHFKKEDVRIPAITIVFYMGKEEWKAARDLKRLLLSNL